MFATFHTTAARAVVGTLGMALCAGVCLVGATAPAAAAPLPAGPVRTAIVRTADLDVHTVAGRAALARRLRHAAESVCPAADGGFAARVDAQRCVHRALATAQPVVG